MLTEKDYCDYDTCVALKELGYDGYCAAYYHLFDDDEDARNSFEHIYAFDFQNSNNIYRVGAPLLYQAQKWLREEKGIIVYPMSIGDLQHQKWYAKIEYMDFYSYPIRDTYEESLAEGIKEAVKILKEEQYELD